MPRFPFIVLAGLVLPSIAVAQFVPILLENRTYWADGKSEIDFYQAEFMRDGEMHACEALVVFTPVFFDPNTTAILEAGKESGGTPAIHMIQTAAVSRGLGSELRTTDALWRM